MTDKYTILLEYVDRFRSGICVVCGGTGPIGINGPHVLTTCGCHGSTTEHLNPIARARLKELDAA
jgi:hypothetical protein